jgi:hypothetical protein
LRPPRRLVPEMRALTAARSQLLALAATSAGAPEPPHPVRPG